jgi:hypothetical protein
VIADQWNPGDVQGREDLEGFLVLCELAGAGDVSGDDDQVD